MQEEGAQAGDQHDHNGDVQGIMEFLLCGCRFSGFAHDISLDNQQGSRTQLHGD